MKDKQKVYIQGVPGRGKEVIQTLVNLGGINCNNLYGENNKYYYYITSDNEIKMVFIVPTVKSLFKELLQKIKLPN